MPIPRSASVLSLLLASAIAGSPVRGQLPTCTPGPLEDSASLLQIFQKACHNCYEKQYAKTFQSVFEHVEAVEIDFYDTRDLVSGGKPYSWYVRHGSGTLFQSGNDNNCTGDGTGKNDLEACLRDVKAASEAHPDHPLYVVYLDKKQGWGPTRQPVDLDNQLRKLFSESRIFRPRDLQQDHPSLRAAAQAGAWPSYASLKNKLMFVLTAGQDGNHLLSEYVSKRGKSGLIFMAPHTNEISDVTGIPSQFNFETAPAVVVYNLKDGAEDLAPIIHVRSSLSRLWGGKENSLSYTSNLIRCVSFIALYDYKQTKFNNGRMDGTFE